MKNKPLSDLLKTKMFIYSAVAGASGWELGQVRPENLTEQLLYLYVYDTGTGKSWAAGVPLRSFIEVNTLVSQRKVDFDDIRSACGTAIVDYMDGAHIKPGELPLQERLAAMVSAYAGTTVTWQKADRFSRGGHFIVIFYRNSGQKDGLLRPAGEVKSPDRILPAETFLQFARSIEAYDLKNNPAWFK